MPELPEVEVIRRGLAPRLVGRRFLTVTVGDKRLRRGSPAEHLAEWLPGRRVLRLERRGKYLLFHLDGGVTLLIHLGMTGRLLLGVPADHGPHVHLFFTLEGGVTLAFQDARRFGQVLVFAPGQPLTPLEQVGREPFSRRATPEWLAETARGRSRPLKNFLLDGRILAGIGNIYASEIMFAAGLHPATPAGALGLEAWQTVLRETRRILEAGHPAGRHYGEQLPEQPRRDRAFSGGTHGVRPRGGALPPLRESRQAPGPGRPLHLFLPALPAEKKTFLIAIFLING